MTTPHPRRRHAPRRRAGFTIVELLMVILIIGVLAALLIPAIQNAIRNAREAEVVVEIKGLEKGITDFNNRFGMDPPSFIVLCEQATDWAADWSPSGSPPVAGLDEIHRRTSRALVRQLWPDFDFAYSDPVLSGAMDINGDGDTVDTLVLNGAECLVFFLGGVSETNVVDRTGALKSGATAGDPITWWSPIGFAANPQYPFARGENRVGPFVEFDAGPDSRVRDVSIHPALTTEFMPEYVDTLSGQENPFAYVSSYHSRGYQVAGPDGTAATIDDELIGLTTAIYFTDDNNPAAGSVGPPYNPNTFQIISPGGDTEYGAGGEYNNEGVPSARANERDNITNFKGGRLN
jgi:general secretion pathway protein G